jgi:hypothetical protein
MSTFFNDFSLHVVCDQKLYSASSRSGAIRVDFTFDRPLFRERRAGQKAICSDGWHHTLSFPGTVDKF